MRLGTFCVCRQVKTTRFQSFICCFSQANSFQLCDIVKSPNLEVQIASSDKGMAATVTMVQPPPAREPSSSSSRPCAPRPPPPPNRPGARSAVRVKGKHPRESSEFERNVRRKNISTLAFPKPLRDVTVFDKKYQVGQGTYG